MELLLITIIAVLVLGVFLMKNRKTRESQGGSKKTNIIHDYSNISAGSIVPSQIYKAKK